MNSLDKIVAGFYKKMELMGIIHDQELNIIYMTNLAKQFCQDQGLSNNPTASDFFEKFHALCLNPEEVDKTFRFITQQSDLKYQEEIQGLEGKVYHRITKTLKDGAGNTYRHWVIRDFSDFVGDQANNIYIQEQLELQAQQNAHLAEELFDAREELERLANTDPLSGLLNRRSFMNAATDLIATVKDTHKVYVMMIDIDHFKSINDTKGHATGDHCICVVADLLTAKAPKDSFVGRLGGEEFAIMLTSETQTPLEQLAETIRQSLENEMITFEAHTINMTVSIGLSACKSHEEKCDPALDRADQGLYKAKENGRNQIHAVF
ncbi:GGDEF domain-containing protein [Temperatibacter marinus]|uniref:diguanylate cyclase n=1 Tax=Temperatibacter marinus TaxID=1456591 RepID=A0AA52ECW8_9PROT|nr:GGDEF domain-containing protein [Temperatibacter marinus]WND02446.1 GGDEF domain-containing protein [Temperatibacter marinus]